MSNVIFFTGKRARNFEKRYMENLKNTEKNNKEVEEYMKTIRKGINPNGMFAKYIKKEDDYE